MKKNSIKALVLAASLVAPHLVASEPKAAKHFDTPSPSKVKLVEPSMVRFVGGEDDQTLKGK
jgi:hypothetical protein